MALNLTTVHNYHGKIIVLNLSQHRISGKITLKTIFYVTLNDLVNSMCFFTFLNFVFI